MPQVRVFNDNVHDYSETFREVKLKIPAKGFILMDAEEAHLFKGTFAGILRDADDNPDPKGFKMIRIEPISAEAAAPEAEKFLSHHDGKSFDTKAELLNHLEQFKDEVVVDEEAEKELAAKKKMNPTKKKGAA